ncbi:UNVERIFIED_CONTAM: hypothetical protein K2H54_077410, partial [Gekko kuhli]
MGNGDRGIDRASGGWSNFDGSGPADTGKKPRKHPGFIPGYSNTKKLLRYQASTADPPNTSEEQQNSTAAGTNLSTNMGHN